MIRRLGIAEDPVHSARSQPCIFMQSWCVLYAAHPTLFGCEINSNKPDYINNGANLPTAFQGYPHPNCETSRATRRVDKANFFTKQCYSTIVECNSMVIVPDQGHNSNSVRVDLKMSSCSNKTIGQANNGQRMAQKPFTFSFNGLLEALKNSNTAGEVQTIVSRRSAAYSMQPYNPRSGACINIQPAETRNNE